MKISVAVLMNLKTAEAGKQVKDATQKALTDVVAAIANTVIHEHPWKTQSGHNSRSIKYEVGPSGAVAKAKLEGAVYSTSGYGGYLETGTVNMDPFPYFKPALDRNIHKLPEGIKAELG